MEASVVPSCSALAARPDGTCVQWLHAVAESRPVPPRCRLLRVCVVEDQGVERDGRGPGSDRKGTGLTSAAVVGDCGAEDEEELSSVAKL